jgi:hypothetical protein
MATTPERTEGQLLWCHDNVISQALGRQHWSEEVMRADLRLRRRPTTFPCSILHGSFVISSGQRIGKPCCSHPPLSFSVGAG